VSQSLDCGWLMLFRGAAPNTVRRFHCCRHLVLHGGDPLPLVSFLLARHESTIDLEYENRIRITDLPRDELRVASDQHSLTTI